MIATIRRSRGMKPEMLRQCRNISAYGRFAWAGFAIWRWIEITLPFQGARRQIGDASTRADDFRAVIGPAAERHCHRAGVGTAGWAGARRTGWQDAAAADRDASPAARYERAADRRCGGAVVS